MLNLAKSSLILSLCISFVLSVDKICHMLNVGTNPAPSTFRNIVEKGMPREKWHKMSRTPEIVPSTKHIEFFYITNLNFQLNEADITLDKNDDFSNASFSLIKENKTYFTIQVDYKCQKFGGTLVDFSMTISLKDCGKATFYWKKLCGDMNTKREGFSIDMEYQNKNVTIVSDGKPVNAALFDKDKDNGVITFQPSENQTRFFLYMHFRNTTKRENEDPAVSILRLLPITSISPPKVDADQNVLYPVLKGNVSKGGNINDFRSTLLLEYNCIANKNGESWVELTIPLDYFNDVSLRFIKLCGAATASKGSAHTFFWWVFLLCFIGAIYFLANHFVFKNKGLLESLPTLKALRRRFAEVPFGQWVNKFSYKQVKYERQSKRCEDEESEFKIEDMREIKDSKNSGGGGGYGSI